MEYKEFSGGFNRNVAIFSVSRKGVLTRIARSGECTFAGDRPSPVVRMRTDEPLMAVVFHGGNGSWEQFFPTPSAKCRLDRNNLSPEWALRDWTEATLAAGGFAR